MTGTGKEHDSGKHSEAGQKFHADAKVKDQSKADKQSAVNSKTPAPGKARAKAADGKFTKSPESPDSRKKAVNIGSARGNNSFPASN